MEEKECIEKISRFFNEAKLETQLQPGVTI